MEKNQKSIFNPEVNQFSKKLHKGLENCTDQNGSQQKLPHDKWAFTASVSQRGSICKLLASYSPEGFGFSNPCGVGIGAVTVGGCFQVTILRLQAKAAIV